MRRARLDVDVTTQTHFFLSFLFAVLQKSLGGFIMHSYSLKDGVS